MLKNLIYSIFITSNFWSFGQEVDITWADFNQRKGQLISILPSGENSFYTLRWSGTQLLGHYVGTYRENLKVTSNQKFKLVVNNSIANFEGARSINGNFAFFLSDKREGMNKFYMQIYDNSFVSKGETVELAEYDLSNGGNKGWFDVIQSNNEDYYAVIWQIPGRKSDNEIYGFKVFDKENNLINEGEYPIPFSPDLSRINKHYISNKGEYYLVLSELRMSQNNSLFRQKEEFKKHIYHINEDGLTDYELQVDGKLINAIALSSNSDDDVFTITGIYGTKDSRGVTGVFYQKINLKTNEVLDENFKDFDQNFITQGWSDRAITRANRRKARGKGEPQFYNYQMRKAVIQDDGSIIGTMEQYYIQQTSSPSTYYQTSANSYYYYYNDIVVYKINPDGTFDWLKKIDKYQVSSNDGGPFSSYESYLHKDKLYFIFNDNVDNYDEDGNYKNVEIPEVANFGRKKNVVAITSLDINTGEVNRKTLFDRKEVSALAIPKLFKVDYDNNYMILYTVFSNKEKFGLLHFN